MKHKPKVVLVILAMFVLTQFIGLFVVNHYIPDEKSLPFGIESPQAESDLDYYSLLFQIIIAFIIAIGILFILIKHDLSVLLKVWFFLVVVLALGISFNAFLSGLKNPAFVAAVLAIPLAYIKMYKQDFFVHNLTEFFIYPGIAGVFVPVLSPFTIILLLLLISGYDMWAVWKSGIMQKMAKYQMDTLKVFSGFFVPYLTDKQKTKLKKAREEASKKSKKPKQKEMKVNVAILGGGDVIFPIVTAGVFLQAFGWIPALFTILGATLGLAYLFIYSEKKKFYPAMPFITIGIFLGLIASWFLI